MVRLPAKTRQLRRARLKLCPTRFACLGKHSERRLYDFNLNRVQLLFCRFTRFRFCSKCFFEFNPWQTIIDFNPGSIHLGFTDQFEDTQISEATLKRLVKAASEFQIQQLWKSI